jgi:hypothetical protein
LKSSQSIAFGVNLAKLDYSLITGEITITPFTFANRPILKGPTEETEESITKVYLVDSDEENERQGLFENPECQAFKMFSEGKSPLEVAIALDQPAGRVRAIYREFWELNNMYQLVETYDQIKDYLPSILRLHKIINDLGTREQEIINVLELANNHQLKHLQWKVEYLRNDIDMLEVQKAKCSNHILILNRRIDEFRGTLNNSSKFSQPNASWYSVDISYPPKMIETLRRKNNHNHVS